MSHPLFCLVTVLPTTLSRRLGVLDMCQREMGETKEDFWYSKMQLY